MPIIAIEENSLHQRCAACEAERFVVLDELPSHEEIPKEVLALPPCACGAVEHLIRAPADDPEHPDPGGFGHLHRLLVDALVDELRTSKQALTRGERALRSRVEGRLPKAQRERWFAGGLRLEATRTDEISQGKETTR